MRMQYAQKKAEKMTQPLVPWLVCLSASLFFFYEFIQGTMFASIADNIMQDFKVQADKMTYLSSAYYASTVFFLLIAGSILDKFSVKKTIIIAMLLCVLSTFMLARAESFYTALACRFITGIGSAFCFLGPIRLAAAWFPPRRMALVTGVIVTIAMTGGMLAQYPLTKLVAQVGWRHALTEIAWLGVIMLILMQFGIIDKSFSSSSGKTKSYSGISTYVNSQNLKAACYTSLMNMAIAIFGAMMGSLYLVQKLGVTKEQASVVNSMLFLGAIIGGPVIGWISDKLALRVLPMKSCALISCFLLCLVLFAPVPISVMQILFFLTGFFTAGQIISYALVAESNSFAVTSRAVSVVSVLTQGGYIIYQNLFSFLLVKQGGMHIVQGIPIYSLRNYQIAAVILPLGLLAAFFISFSLKETYGHRIEKEINP